MTVTRHHQLTRQKAAQSHLLASPARAQSHPPTVQSTGTTIWNKLRAAKDIINTAVTGEERWSDSDDSDYEGEESHVTRMLREYKEKKETDAIAQKILELEMTPYSPLTKSQSAGNGRSHYRRHDFQESDSSSTPTPPTTGFDHYGRPFKAQGMTIGHQHSRSEGNVGSQYKMRARGESNASLSNGVSNSNSDKARFNRYRTASDASRDEALSRLEGKRTADVLAAQINHLGSTGPRARAQSPHRGVGARRQIPELPSVPSPTPAANSNMGAFVQRQQLQ
ncbi:hypothetical protein BGZ94_003211 [Podila epigama]|nr:hypothetical protein BGZ94_003211 [Podila epigama]